MDISLIHPNFLKFWLPQVLFQPKEKKIMFCLWYIHKNTKLSLDVIDKDELTFFSQLYQNFSSLAFWSLWIAETNIWTQPSNHLQEKLHRTFYSSLIWSQFLWIAQYVLLAQYLSKTQENVSKWHRFSNNKAWHP